MINKIQLEVEVGLGRCLSHLCLLHKDDDMNSITRIHTCTQLIKVACVCNPSSEDVGLLATWLGV